MQELTVTETARRLGLDPSGVRRYLRLGRLRGRLIGGKVWLVDARSVAAFSPDPPGPKKSKVKSQK